MRPSSPPPTPPAPPAASLEDFCKAALRSGLLSDVELLAAVHALSAGQQGDAAALAEFLIKTGKLSRFQARKLLSGRWRGLVLGPFQVLSLIGKGGTGAVFLARDSRDGRLVALKVLKTGRTEDRIRARFLREMEINRDLAHPHLARAFEAGHVQGVDYLAMEYIPGQSLHRLVSQEGPLAVSRAARLFLEVATALHYAHGRGLVHRDLKPSNVMVTPHDHAKLLDLGLALVRGEVADRDVIGGQGYVVGTMDFIAPEQAANPILVDARSDVYALGCSLYYALSGRPPFPGGTNREKIQRHRTAEPPPLEELRPTLPPSFTALVRRMLAKKPADRFATAADVAAALRPWAVGEVVQPLDQPDDPTYAEAVAALQATDAGVEESQLDLPAGPSPRRGLRLAWLAAGVVALLALGVLLPLLWLLWRGQP
jgi:serine/threonine protein kinase